MTQALEATKDRPLILVLAIMLILISLFMLSSRVTPRPIDQTNNTVSSPRKRIHQPRIRILPDAIKTTVSDKPDTFVSSKQKDKTFTSGHLPAIDAKFDMPVLRYASILEKKAGAQLILFDARHHRILGRYSAGRFISSPLAAKGMSMRTRNITRDLNRADRQAMLSQAHVTGESLRFLIMLPIASEQKLERTISYFTRALGFDWQDIASMYLRYRLVGNNIYADVKTINVHGAVYEINKSVRIW